MKRAALWSGLLLLAIAWPGTAQYYLFVWDSQAFYDVYTYQVYGYSRTFTLGRDWPVAVRSTLYDPDYRILDTNYDEDWWWDGWASADVSWVLVPGSQFNQTYWIVGDHWYAWYEWYTWWIYLGDSLAGIYVAPDPQPMGETTQGAGWDGGNPLLGRFYATLYPLSVFYDGHWVWERLTNITDTCAAQAPGYGTWPDPKDSSWVVSGATYGPDSIGTDREWVETFTDLIKLNTISPCGWSATQTMYYGLTPFGAGASYSTSMIGMFLDGVRASTTRGGVTQYYNLGPD